VDQLKNENRKYYFFLIFALAVITAFTLKFYIAQKKQNHSLRLKMALLSKERRKPKPWGRLLAPAPVTTAQLRNAKGQVNDSVTSSAAAPQRMENTGDIKNSNSEALANELNIRMKKLKTMDAQQLQKTVDIADEIISREPDSYSAFKAKLIALLTMESKLNIPVDDNTVEGLLDEMARFDVSSDAVMRKEAALISTTENNLNTENEKLNDLTNQRVALENEMTEMSTDEPNYKILEARRTALAALEENQIAKLAVIQESAGGASLPEEAIINEDIVQIPFMRMMAKNDLSGLIANAETFIQQFPESPIGYFYAVRGLEMEGREDEALDVIAKSRLGNADQGLLLERLNQARSEDPKKYWERLNF
jgi:hypothetical protein